MPSQGERYLSLGEVLDARPNVGNVSLLGRVQLDERDFELVLQQLMTQTIGNGRFAHARGR